jgi:ketosteroid isomerase-like protein
MSRENVERVLRGIEAFNRRDLEGALAPFHADVRFYDAGTGHVAESRAALGKMLKEWLDSFAEYRELPEEALDLGDEIVVLVHTVARGHASGITVEERHGEIHQFRDGLVISLTAYPTPEAALEAAGLAE